MSDLPSPRFEYRDTFLLAGLRRVHSPETAAETIPVQWLDFAGIAGLPAMDQRRYGVMCGTSEAGFEYMTAVEVPSFADLPADLGRMRVPAQRYAIFDPGGLPLSELWTAIYRWLEYGPFRSAHRPDFELYQGPGGESRSLETEIWVGVVPADGADS